MHRQISVAESWDEASRAALTLALSEKEREQEFRLTSHWGEGLGMGAIVSAISH